MEPPSRVHPRAINLADEIADNSVRELFQRFVTAVGGLHEGVDVSANRVEIRFCFDGEFICRVAPYRELFHVQIGEQPAWDVRVRDAAAWADTVDRTLQRFVDVYAAKRGPRAAGESPH